MSSISEGTGVLHQEDRKRLKKVRPNPSANTIRKQVHHYTPITHPHPKAGRLEETHLGSDARYPGKLPCSSKSQKKDDLDKSRTVTL